MTPFAAQPTSDFESALPGDSLAAILDSLGTTASLERVSISGLHDEPGFHWSNPGLKLLTLEAGSSTYELVVKRLRPHSKREALIYAFLADRPGAPIPRLHHYVYDDDRDEHYVVLEHCVERSFADARGFWQEVGSLLASIHAMFWDDTSALPAVFDVPRSDAWAWESVCVLTDYVDGLSDDQRATLDDMVGTCWRDLANAAASLEPERMPRTAPSAGRCLVHKAFHAPEIMWREVAGGYESVAVDWEKASIGVPGQDFRVVSELLSDGRDDLVDALFDAYFTTLSQHGIHPDVEALRASAYREAFFDQMVGTRWLLRKYVYVRDDPQLASWREWARQVMPGRIHYLLNNWDGLGEP